MEKHYKTKLNAFLYASSLLGLMAVIMFSTRQIQAQSTSFYEPFKLTTSFYSPNNTDPINGTDLHYKYNWLRENNSNNPDVVSNIVNSQLVLNLSPASTSSSSIFYTETFFFIGNTQQEIRFIAKQNNNAGGNNLQRLLKISVVNPNNTPYTSNDPLKDTLKIVRFSNASAQTQNVVVVNNLNVIGQYRLKIEFELTQTGGNGNNNNIPTLEVSQFQTDLSLLPVNYSMLSAKQVVGTVQIKWSTSMEENSSHFEIERSIDGSNWEMIGSENATVFSTEEVSYSYTDYSPASGTNIYRLKQVDFDGQYAYSKVMVVLMNNTIAEETIQLFPNPSKGIVNIKGVDSPKVTVYNTAGTALYVTQNQTSLNLDFLQLGVYFLQIESQDGTVTKHRFLKD